jgi:hypothetical protein
VYNGDEEYVNNSGSDTCRIYDKNGNALYERNSNVWGIKYNALNLPEVIQFTEGHKNIYTYSAAGKKLSIVNYTLHNPVNVAQGTISTLPVTSNDYTKLTTDYVGNMIYENGSLKEILLPEGYWQAGVYYYYLKDHLGSNRVVISASGTIVEQNHYYPSGMRFGERRVTRYSPTIIPVTKCRACTD